MLKVGGEVDAFCTRCEMVLAHTIHAMLAGRPVKVECNTCHSVHRYRSAGRSGARTGSGASAGEAAKAVAGFDQLLAARNVAAAKPYSPRSRYALGDVVDHGIFGRGFVSALRDGDKIEITFRAEVKILVHGRA
jgi:hypothetical protein